VKRRRSSTKSVTATRISRALAAISVVSLLSAAGAIAATPWGIGLTGGSSGESQSATLQLQATTGASSCNSSASGAAACASGSPVPTGSLSSSSSSASTTLSSPGSANASSANVASATCGVAELADTGSDSSWSGSGSNTALALGGLSYQASGPLSSQAITTDGSTGWAETTGEYTNPETFTILAWFKTSSAAGSIIGFSNNQTAPVSATNDDRMLWIDPTGHVVWGVFNSAPDEVTSSSTYANGAWHFVAASIGSAGQQLYLDGALAGSSSNTGAQSYSGWWSIGYSFAHNAGWPDDPSSASFNGSLAQIAIIPSQLSAAQISSLYADSTLSSYTGAVNALSPANDWALGDSGSVPYEGSIPGETASTTLADASGDGDSGTAQGGVTLGASGPSALGTAISLNGSSGYVQTANSYANPEGFSIVAWFKTTSKGTIIGLTNAQGASGQTDADRMLWVDDSGKLVWGVYPGVVQEVTSPTAYNDGQWHMAVAELGSSGQQLWVDGTEVASNGLITSAQNYTGWWHLGWDLETGGWPDAPSDVYLTGSLSQIAVIPTQLSASQITTLDNAGSAAAYALDIEQLAPTAYWPLQDSASNVCGTTEITVQQTVGATNTCVYPAASGTCASPSSSSLVTGLGVRSITAPTSSTSVTIKITMQLSSASPTGVLGLHELADINFGTALTATLWTAQLAYPSATSQL
jgi:hypothetical protein